MQNIIVATIKEWNISQYFKLKELFQDRFNFHLITNKDELTEEYIKDLNPKYIFFPHWSWIIPSEIYSNYECVVFHITDLPYGRGGSPFQNLVIRGIYDTKISALRVDDGLDAGDIYLKEDFNISTGSAEENFTQIALLAFHTLIPKILTGNLVAQKQIGAVTNFKRRTPKESDIRNLETKTIDKLYDFIRMLDGEGYPKAFLDIDGFKMEYSSVMKKDNFLVGHFTIKQHTEKMDTYDRWNTLKKRIESKNTIPFRQGEIYFMSVGHNIGEEIYGHSALFLRPVLVYKKLSKNTFVGIPLSSKRKEGSYFFTFRYTKKTLSTALLNQICVFDIKRAKYNDGYINIKDFTKLREQVKEFIDITPNSKKKGSGHVSRKLPKSLSMKIDKIISQKDKNVK